MAEEKTMTQGEKIAALRKTKNMTQADLGVALNVSFQAVSKWERDESAPDFDTIARMSHLFNVPLSFFERGSKQSVADAIAATSAPVQTMQAQAQNMGKRLLGVCVDCGRAVYEGERGDAGMKSITTTQNHHSRGHLTTTTQHSFQKAPDGEIVCKSCAQKRAEAYRQHQETERKRHEANLDYVLRRKKKGLIWSIVFTILYVVIGLWIGTSTEENKKEWVIGTLVSIPFAYPFFAQLFWDGAVVDCVTSIMTKSLHLPGIIFSCDFDGLKFLIIMKLLFAVLSFLFGFLMAILGVAVGMFIAPFTFFPALKRMSHEDGLDVI